MVEGSSRTDRCKSRCVGHSSHSPLSIRSCGCCWLVGRRERWATPTLLEKRFFKLHPHFQAPQDGSRLGTRMWHRFKVLSPLLQSSSVIRVSRWRQWGYSTSLISQMSASPIRESRPHLLQTPRLLCPGTPVKCCQRRQRRATNNSICVNQGPTQLALSGDKEPRETSACPTYWCQGRGLAQRLRGQPWTRQPGQGNNWRQKASAAPPQSRRNTLD